MKNLKDLVYLNEVNDEVGKYYNNVHSFKE